jgi:hypothetical protein
MGIVGILRRPMVETLAIQPNVTTARSHDLGEAVRPVVNTRPDSNSASALEAE